MAKIQIQRQFWNQFWSLIPKTVSNLNFFHEKWHFLSTKNSVFWHFWVPKIILLVKKQAQKVVRPTAPGLVWTSLTYIGLVWPSKRARD